MREFIVNLSTKFFYPASPDFQKVYIRRHQLIISPFLIYQFLHRNVQENVTVQRPSLKDLVFELTGGVRFSGPKKGQLSTTVLSVNYALLHNIKISNWCPSSHNSILSISLATRIYQIETRAQFNYGAFVLNQIKHHIRSKALSLPICYPQLIYGILLTKKLDLLDLD